MDSQVSQVQQSALTNGASCVGDELVALDEGRKKMVLDVICTMTAAVSCNGGSIPISPMADSPATTTSAAPNHYYAIEVAMDEIGWQTWTNQLAEQVTCKQ